MRLTKRDSGGNAVMACENCEIKYRESCCSLYHCRNALIQKLAAYEDTGLEPEEIESVHKGLYDFYELEAKGQLVILPCKVGDMVWWIPPTAFTWLEQRPYCCMVVSITMTENKRHERKQKYRIAELHDGKTICNVHDIDFSDIGKTVFLTEKEAKDALKGVEK